METKLGQITQPYIRATFAKNKTSVLELLIFNEKIKKPKKAFRMFSSVIYTIISNYVFIFEFPTTSCPRRNGLPHVHIEDTRFAASNYAR